MGAADVRVRRRDERRRDHQASKKTQQQMPESETRQEFVISISAISATGSLTRCQLRGIIYIGRGMAEMDVLPLSVDKVYAARSPQALG